MWRVGFGLLAAILTFGPVQAEEPLGELLDQLAPEAAPPQGRVDVRGWLEKSSTGSDLVVTLIPQGAARLISDPGLTVTPLPNGTALAPGAAVRLADPSRDYLTEPPVVRVPLPGHAGGPVEARVDYAYCLVHYVCLFGEANLRVEDGAPAS